MHRQNKGFSNLRSKLHTSAAVVGMRSSRMSNGFGKQQHLRVQGSMTVTVPFKTHGYMRVSTQRSPAALLNQTWDVEETKARPQ